MTSLILIPGYLIKNTLQRWLENPASPITKIIITFLFSILALLIFGAFQHLETTINKQLHQDEFRVITTHEQLFSNKAEQRIYNGTDESYLWSPYSKRYDSFQQAPLRVNSLHFKRIPLLSYDALPSFTQLPTFAAGEPRPAVILSRSTKKRGQDYIQIRDIKIPATRLPFPEILKKRYRNQAIALIPSEFIYPILEKGFIQHQIILPKDQVSTEELENLIQSYAQAEGHNITIQSSVGILKKLEDFLSQQQQARLIIGGFITIILSLTLGSLSLLEFRQESYLFALLRSFGVRSIYLFLHYLLETTALTFSGLWAAQKTITQIIPTLLSSKGLFLNAEKAFKNISTTVSYQDLRTLAIAVSLGIIILSNRHGGKLTADLEHLRHFRRVIETVIITRATLRDMNRGVNPLFSQLTIETNLHISSALELLENNIIHFRFCFNQGRSKNRQTSTFFAVPRSSKKLPTLLKRYRTQSS